ncbi:MAG: hypothetical protein WA354_08850, partial [Terracidiphilus sp.]
SKAAPATEQIPAKYGYLIDWYRQWSENGSAPSSNWEDDPLIRLIGSGKDIWSDEHADDYVENLRREDI